MTHFCVQHCFNFIAPKIEVAIYHSIYGEHFLRLTYQARYLNDPHAFFATPFSPFCFLHALHSIQAGIVSMKIVKGIEIEKYCRSVDPGPFNSWIFIPKHDAIKVIGMNMKARRVKY